MEATLSRLTLFSLLTAWANLLHQLSFPSWILGLDPVGWTLFLFSAVGAARPSCFPVFLSVLVLRVVYTVQWTPMIRGHLFLEGFFTVATVAGIAFGMWRLRKVRSFTSGDGEEIFESFAPMLRITTLLTYLAVTLSKLNVDFIDPEKSAAVQLLLWAAKSHPWIPLSPGFYQLAIWGAILIEIGIPVLLCFRRTRWWGLVAGVLFHTLLGFLPLKIASFSLTMCLLLASWLPRGSGGAIYSSFSGIAVFFRIPPYPFFLLASFIAGCTGMAYAGRHGISMDMAAVDLGIGMWWWQTVAILLALRAIRGIGYERLGSELVVRPALGWVYVGLFSFNCLCPYIGLKSRGALTMHCNLRTEQGYWNHLILPEAMRVFGFQSDLVEVVDSDLPDFEHLKNNGMELPYFEFRRWCRLAEDDFFVDYRRRKGGLERFEKKGGEGSDPRLMVDRGVTEWLLCFNPVGASHDYLPALAKRTGPARNIVPKSSVKNHGR